MRQPSGRPTGGQFAEHARHSSGLALEAAAEAGLDVGAVGGPVDGSTVFTGPDGATYEAAILEDDMYGLYRDGEQAGYFVHPGDPEDHQAIEAAAKELFPIRRRGTPGQARNREFARKLTQARARGRVPDAGQASLPEVDMSGADLRGGDFSATVLDRAKLVETDFRDADLGSAMLYWADLTRAKLAGADLNDAQLTNATLVEADLEGADLTDAYLAGANFRRANLRGVTLRGADLADVDFRGSDMRGAHLEGALIDGKAIDLTRPDWASHPRLMLS